MARTGHSVTILTATGDVVPNAPIEIRLYSTGLLANIYEQDGAPITQTGATADENGIFRFWADPDEYFARHNGVDVPVTVGLSDGDGAGIKKTINDISFFGGSDDGETDNIAAIELAKSNNVSSVKLSSNNDSVYYFGNISATLFDNITLICDDDITISLQQTDNYELVDSMNIVGNPTIYDRNISRNYVAEKRKKNYTTMITGDDSKAVAISSTQLRGVSGTLGSDTLTEQNFYTSGGTQISPTGLAAGSFASVTYPCEIGERICMNFSDGNLTKGIAILTADETYLLYENELSTNITAYYKKVGETAVYGTITSGIGSFKLNRSQVGAIRTKSNECEIVLNGSNMTGFLPVISLDSDIEYIGACFVPTSASEVCHIKNFYREINSKLTSAALNIAVYGDSLTDTYVNDWVSMSEKMLKANGYDITTENFAIAGENSAQQLARFNSNGVGIYNTFILALGTNDIQLNVSISNYINNIISFVTQIRAAGRKLIMAVPPMWMTQEMGGGDGYNTSRYNEGADHRGTLIRYCQDNDIPYFEMSALNGYPRDQNSFWYRDNIHETFHGYESVAIAASKCLLKTLDSYQFERSYRDVELTGNLIPWSGLEIGVSEKDNIVTFKGLINTNGTVLSEGHVIATLKDKFKPQTDKYITVATSWGSPSHVRIEASGNVSIYNVGTPLPGAWVSFDGCNYDLIN